MSGLSNEDYCYLKCWVALVRVGKELLIKILHWGFPNIQQLTLREGLQELPGYSNTRYKNDFNKDERKKIETGIVSDFDITLLNTLIHRLCRLVDPPSAQISTASNKLSEIILRIKDTRNKFAHPLLGLTEAEMSNHVNEMKILFEAVMDEAQDQFQIDVYEVINHKNEMSSQLLQIIQSPLPAASISEQLAQVAREKSRIAIQEGANELKLSYHNFTYLSVTPWPFVPVRRSVSDVFNNINMRFNSSHILQNRLTDEESRVQVNSLLNKTHLDNSEPGFILLNGHSGIGKTTLLKYIIDSWTNDSQHQMNVDKYDLVFYIDCRNTCIQSFQGFLSQVIPNTANLFSDEDLINIIMSSSCLFLLDNIDELSNKSCFVINELISSSSSTIKIVGTASGDPGNNIIQIGHHRNPMNLNIEGLSSDTIRDYVNMLYESIPADYRRSQAEAFFSEILSQDFLLHDWLTNPEILSHVFLHWCLAPNDNARCSTLTNVLLHSFNLIVKKLKDRLSSKSLPCVVEQHLLHTKLQKFLIELGRIAMSTLNNGTTGLDFKSTTYLLLKCEELGLPANIVLSEFLCFRESFDEKILQTSVNVNFPSASFHEFCSAYHLFNRGNVITGSSSLKEELCLDSLPHINSNKVKITKILQFFVGLIAVNDSNRMDKLYSSIIDILQTYCELKKPSQWFQIIEESQGHDKLTKAIINILNNKWQVEDGGISNLVVRLIASSPPDELSIVSIKAPSSLNHLHGALQACNDSEHPINLSLYIYYDFWKSLSEYSDDYLKIVVNECSNINLENFAGKLRSSSYFLLPNSVKRLALQLELSDLKELNRCLPTFKSLQLLSLNISFKEYDTLFEKIEHIHLKKDVMLSLDTWGATSSSYEEYCSLVAAVSTSYTRLAMRRTTLDYKSATKFVIQLGKNKVDVKSVVIGSTVRIKKHEQVNLTADALNHLTATNFKWLDL